MTEYYIYPYNSTRIKDKILLINECCEHLFIEPSEFDLFKKNCELCSLKTIQELKEKFFIVETNQKKYADKIVETKKLTKHSYLTNDALLLMVVPTIHCNCNCIYCQVSSHSDCTRENNLSLKNMISFCDFVFALPHKDIKIEFQGGEPLLAFDAIKFIVKRILILNKRHKCNKLISFVICTNLLALKNDQINFLKKYQIQISTSIDGKKEIHDKNRPSQNFVSTFDVAKEKIELLRKKGIYPSALVTITTNNLDRMKEIIDEYISLGFTGLFLRPLNNYGLAFKNTTIKYSSTDFIKNYKIALEYIISKNLEGIEIKEEYFIILLRKIYSAFNDGFVDMQNPCALGQMCMIVDQHGNVFPCDEARMISEMGDKYWKMGNIQDKNCFVEISDVQKKIRKEGCIDKKSFCVDCVYKPLCSADPIREWYIKNYSGDDYCGIKKDLFNFVFEQILCADKYKRKLFWKWAND